MSGLVCLACAILLNGCLVSALDPNPPIDPVTRSAIGASQWRLALFGFAFAAVYGMVGTGRRFRLLKRLFDRPLATKFLLSVTAVGLPVLLAELCLRPFTIAHLDSKVTSLFVRDKDLGWRLRPGTRTDEVGARVTVNTKGTIGPEVDYARTGDATRLLYLGDSVTFGNRVEGYERSFPYVADSALERAGQSVETINAAVSGYSTWQYLAYLKTEGMKYSPDLVLVGFCLNDAMERFMLSRFGGWGEGLQLTVSYQSLRDWMKHNSSLVCLLDKLVTRRRFGENPRRAAADAEHLAVEDMVRSPADPHVQKGWKMTLEDMEELLAVCQAAQIRVVLVVLPYRFQFDDPTALSSPQQILGTFARERGLPCLDLLPILAERATAQGRPTADLFVDENHFSVLGNELVGESIAEFLQQEGLIPPGDTNAELMDDRG